MAKTVGVDQTPVKSSFFPDIASKFVSHILDIM